MHPQQTWDLKRLGRRRFNFRQSCTCWLSSANFWNKTVFVNLSGGGAIALTWKKNPIEPLGLGGQGQFFPLNNIQRNSGDKSKLGLWSQPIHHLCSTYQLKYFKYLFIHLEPQFIIWRCISSYVQIFFQYYVLGAKISNCWVSKSTMIRLSHLNK